MKVFISIAANPSDKKAKAALTAYNKAVSAILKTKGKLDNLLAKKKVKSTPALVKSIEQVRVQLAKDKAARVKLVEKIKKSGIKLPKEGRLSLTGTVGKATKKVAKQEPKQEPKKGPKEQKADFKARVAGNIAKLKKATIDKIADPKSSAKGVRLTVANGKSVDIYTDDFHPMVGGTIQSHAGLERGIKGSFELYKSEYETAKKRLESGERMTAKDKLKTTRNMEYSARGLKPLAKAVKLLGLK